MPEKYVPQQLSLTDVTKTHKTDVQQRINMKKYNHINHIELNKEMKEIHHHTQSRAPGGVTHVHRHVYEPDGRTRRHTEARIADLNRVVDTITKKVWDKELAQRLIDKVTTYWQTHDKRYDLTNPESAEIYRNVNLNQEFNLPNDKELDIKIKNHAKYREELRDINPKKVNEQVKKDMIKRLNQHKTQGDERLKTPQGETIVVDYNLEQYPNAEVDVITVWK